MSDKLGTQNEDGLVDPDSSMRSAYIKENLPLQFGKNYLKLSTLYSLAELLNWGAYKRVKLNRNTILLIVRI